MSDNSWWFLDLAALIAATGAITLGLFSGISSVGRIALAMPLVLFFPGYALVAALFPDDSNDEQQSFDEERTGLGRPVLLSGGIEATERFVMSVAFSVALVPGITLITTVTPWGVTAEPVLFGISILTISLAIIAIVGRYRISPEHRFTPSVSSVTPFISQSRSTPYDRTNTRPYNIAIVIGLLLLVASAGFAVANPIQSDGFTEFSIETSDIDGDTDTIYESEFVSGEPQELPISITNQEHSDQSYTAVVFLQDVEYGEDSVTIEAEEELARESMSVPDGETHEQSIEVTPTMGGENLRLELLLYEGDPPSNPTAENAYRTIPLPIESQ